MKIVILSSSPHLKGTSSLLVDEFIRGASSHEIIRHDVAFKNIGPCLGCDRCMMNGPCIQDDDMKVILDDLLECDMVVFASPLYYFGMSAQLKLVIDRFYSRNGRLQRKHLKSALLSTCFDSNEDAMKGLKLHYEILVDYLNLDDQGAIYGLGCGNVNMTQTTKYPRLAYELGKRV